MSYEKHYREHLSSFYSWMAGDFEQAVSRQQDFFQSRALTPASTAIAVDLGCGSGFQSLALRHLGFKVVAVDTSAELLAELAARDPAIERHQRDIRDLSFLAGLHPELIVCMGDTLTHLEEPGDVARLLAQSFAVLAPGGRLALTFRDLSAIRGDTDRFIPVRSDEARILTCFLEEAGDKVRVTDLLHERTPDGWTLKKSSYLKLKLTAGAVSQTAADAGFAVTAGTLPSGLIVVLGKKP
jgi:SAM-dependent methyltransferase